MQGNYADRKTTGTPDLQLHRLDNTEETSECQRSAFQMNQSTAQKTCLPKLPWKVLQYRLHYVENLFTYFYMRKHVTYILECNVCYLCNTYFRLHLQRGLQYFF